MRGNAVVSLGAGSNDAIRSISMAVGHHSRLG
jgi:hypothetical protein